MTGPEDEVEAALLRLWYQVQQPMKVTFNGNTMETIDIMYVDGQRYFGTEAVSSGPDVALIAAVSAVALLALVVIVLIVVWLKKKKAQKSKAWANSSQSSAFLRPRSVAGQSQVHVEVASHEMKDLEASLGKTNSAFTMQETKLDKTDIQSRPVSRSSVSPRSVSPPGYVCEEENDLPKPRNLTVQLLDKHYRKTEMEKTWLDMNKTLKQVREDLVAAFPDQLEWQDFVFLTPGLTHVDTEAEDKKRLKDIVEVGEDVVTIHMV